MTDQFDISLRPLVFSDLPAVLAIQSEAYPAFLRDSGDALASRLALASAYCLAATRNDALVAYLIAHGWPSGDPPPVDTVLAPAPSDVLFVHDLAVASAGRGLGVGRRLIHRACALAARDGLLRAELIAVEGAAGFWRGLGFRDAPCPASLADKIAAYGREARWMSADLADLCSGA